MWEQPIKHTLRSSQFLHVCIFKKIVATQMTCSFEYDRNCYLKNASLGELKETWACVAAWMNNPEKDHTLDSGETCILE